VDGQGGFLVFYLACAPSWWPSSSSCAFCRPVSGLHDQPAEQGLLARPRAARPHHGDDGGEHAWLGVLILALFIGMGYLTFQADLMPQPHLDETAGVVMMGRFSYA